MSTPATPVASTSGRPRFSNAYELFILVLTIVSLVIMVGLVAHRTKDATWTLLNWYDNIICLVFIGDFIARLRRAPTKRTYFIDERGWLDLLGSIPSFGFLAQGGKWTSLFRLARLSRVTRIRRQFQGQSRRELIDDVVRNRGEYAVVITLTAAMVVLVFASIFVLQFESTAPDGNIKTGGQAVWWSIVTITTVGYGDYTPVTPAGRIVGFFVMLTGIGIIGALASIFASFLVTSESNDSEPAADPGVERELRALREEVAALRRDIGGANASRPDG
ncbi:MAG TPA: ion transporter [Actinomycetota bacterium]|nr:ion transporter [Actinomycetota bacterium]